LDGKSISNFGVRNADRGAFDSGVRSKQKKIKSGLAGAWQPNDMNDWERKLLPTQFTLPHGILLPLSLPKTSLIKTDKGYPFYWLKP